MPAKYPKNTNNFFDRRKAGTGGTVREELKN